MITGGGGGCDPGMKCIHQPVIVLLIFIVKFVLGYK